MHFNKGNLAGYSFELSANGGYHHSTKTFKIKQFTDERGQKFPDPNTIFQAEVGDEFTLLDIVMPQAYIARAEQKLYEEAQKEYQKVAQNNVKYELNIDPSFLKEKQIFLGDYIRIKDEDFAVNKQTRIIGLKHDILNKKTSFDVADSYEFSLVKEIINDISGLKKIIKTEKQVNRELYKAGYDRLKELQESIFDTDGYFDPQNIKPLSIETQMLSVGSKSQQFTLEEVIFKPNLNDNPNAMHISGGRLVHFSLEETGFKEWHLTEKVQDNLEEKPYYIYAKCQKKTTQGEFLITTEKIKFNQETEHYHFLLAVLHSPKNGVRFINLMYGATYINGAQITTGRISSQDGSQYIDLLQDKIKIVADVEFSAENKKEILEGIQIGGRNLILNSSVRKENDNYQIAEYPLSQNNQYINGEEYTITIWGYLNPAKSHFSVYNSGGTVELCRLSKISEGVYTGTFRWGNSVVWRGNTYTANNSSLHIYQVLDTIEAISSIEKIKLEKGNKATDWTPAPEDLQSQIALAETNAKTHATQEVNNLQIGSRNLLLKSNEIHSNSNYNLCHYVITEDIQVGEEITLSYEGELAPNGILVLFNGSGDGNRGSIMLKPNEKQKTIKWTNNNDEKITKGTAMYVYIQNVPRVRAVNNYASTIKKIKLEKGNKATDWTPAPEDIDAQILPLKEKTDFFNNTKIKGNFITSQTLEMGNEQGAEAGITGEGLESDAVRFWAGASFENRGKAPFRVLDNGTLHAENAHIKGKIEATSGKIGGFQINSSADTKLIANGLQLESGGLIRSRGSGDNSHSTAFIVNEKNTLNDVLSHSPCLSIHTSAFDQKSHSAASFSSIGANNTALRLRATKTTGTARALHIEEGIITGRQAIFETPYIGQAYWGAIEEHLHLTNTFIFTSAPNHHQSVVLPSESKIRQIVGHSNVSFELRIIVAYNCHQLIRIQGQNGGSLVNNDGNWANGQNGYLDLGRGDTLTLRHCDSHYYIMSHRQ